MESVKNNVFYALMDEEDEEENTLVLNIWIFHSIKQLKTKILKFWIDLIHKYNFIILF